MFLKPLASKFGYCHVFAKFYIFESTLHTSVAVTAGLRFILLP